MDMHVVIASAMTKFKSLNERENNDWRS
jgi:hypothetical protein